MQKQKSSFSFTPPETREQLRELLVRAAALEHVLLSAYLFTSYSLKQDLSEGGFSEGKRGKIELGVTQQWSGLVTGVAVQEMLHLALACNMMSAIGFDPEFRREELNFPISPEQMERTFGYAGQAYLGLWPFSKETIERYAWFEDYDHEPDSFPGAPWGDTAMASRSAKSQEPVLLEGLEEMNISSLVELYQAIAVGFAILNEQGIFSGSEGVQVTDLEVTGLFNYPPAKAADGNGVIPLLTPVTDLRSALIAINTIVVQGEGDEEEWRLFMTSLCILNGLDYNNFPIIESPPHHEVFNAILNGGTLVSNDKPTTVHGINAFPNWQNFVRNVPANPLVNSPCGGNPTCENHVHLITNEYTQQVASLLNELYGTMLDLLVVGFSLNSDTTPLEPDQSDQDYFIVGAYEKATLIQASIRSMVYLMSPLANALMQLPASPNNESGQAAGPGFVYSARSAMPSWEELSSELRRLSVDARALGSDPQAANLEVWIRPSYYDVPPSGHAYPRYSMQKLLIEALAADLAFLSDRLTFVKGNAPPKQTNGQPYPQHVCYGLNACQGQDITGMAPAAGAGKCATADPHVCSGQNHCAGQGGCGFSPGGLSQAKLQNHPGKNTNSGQVKQDNGYWTDNPASDSACGSPIMPSIRNTYGVNNPLGSRGGSPYIYNRTKGYVWEFARLLFDQDNQGAAPSDYNERYRDPYQTEEETA